MRVDAFVGSLRARGLSSRTVAVYRDTASRFAKWWEGVSGRPFDPAEVTPLDVADYRRRLLEAGKRPSTANANLDALRVFFACLVESGAVAESPVEGVRRVPAGRTPPRWLTRREVNLLVRALWRRGSPLDRALVALLLHAGLRVSEAAGLAVSDVVLRERSGWVVVRRGKGSKSREVPLNVTARRMISEWLASHPGGDYLFPGKSGGPVTPRAVQKRLRELGRLAGVDVTPHRLRHTFCKALVDAGEGLDRVAVLAGHSNLNTTAVYTKPGKADLERAVEKLSWD